MKRKVEVSNDVHHTTATAVVDDATCSSDGAFTLSVQQVKRLRTKLCTADCTCFASHTKYVMGCRQVHATTNTDGTITLV